ncbi:MAG TPA: NYN domain-containing protein [Steroidobacteraceae bacterium]|nr:NYN domain-containing protein [Steroidobacteraceae bacterium]
MQQGTDNALRTRVYIDGYNLYYGCLKHSTDKWLDVRTLIERILPSILFEQDGEPVRFAFQTPAVKYFTAPILTAFAKSDDSISCQSHYHTALCAHLGGAIEIIKGYHDAKPSRAHVWEEGKAARECKMIEIWKLEEKQSDVAFALNAFSDAIRNEVGQVIAVTNDSDFAPAMKMIRQYTRAIVGLIAPARQQTGNVNAELQKHAHWTRTHILDEEFAQSHLPPMIRLKNKAVHKPLSWYPRPDLLVPIYEEAKRVKRSEGAARKWLNQPCVHLGGRIPITMCESTEEAVELRKYMDQYAKEFGI